MAQFNKNAKVYAGSEGVSMLENAKSRGIFSKASPDILNPCITHYRKYLSEQQESQEPYRSLHFLSYVIVPIRQRIWLPESYIGIATGKRTTLGGTSYIQVQYDANKLTFNNDELAAHSVIQRLAWVKEFSVSETGY